MTQDMQPSIQPPMPPRDTAQIKMDRSKDFATVSAPDRVTYQALYSQHQTTTPVPLADVTRLCGDKDGCSIRMGMFNWDGAGRVASRDFLFFYNGSNRAWRASQAVGIASGYNQPGDPAGLDNNQVVEHVNQTWSCYFTDGEYSNGNGSDLVAGFGLLSWTQYAADCWMTIID
jgi:hypothetical protein